MVVHFFFLQEENQGTKKLNIVVNHEPVKSCKKNFK